MSIFLNENSKVIVQGMTGSEGRKHTQRMLTSGTAIVGGVNPKKAGESVEFDGATVPVFGSVGGGEHQENEGARLHERCGGLCLEDERKRHAPAGHDRREHHAEDVRDA